MIKTRPIQPDMIDAETRRISQVAQLSRELCLTRRSTRAPDKEHAARLVTCIDQLERVALSV